MASSMKSSLIPSICCLRIFFFTAQYLALYGERYSARVTGDDVDGFYPVSLPIIFFNGVVNVDVYVAGGVDGSYASHSSGGADGAVFSDAANAL